ncbi:arginine repressor [Actinomyces bowdenii]|uniref:Arginine repressor n=1 Tax=Actinomyces bowdenii TaxID=131109 RepID=A0A853EL25_9ACTO|nr:ArgR family transcriptional regulator [Actinomyces bowdenii]MBF0697057.1 ArgR family transcriptional regulator [Actinomyces bowdenii]MCR2053609.1 ArgR family transcriptional regulator [Actinomyces bowdenii]MDO5064679.1 ArgR family transcriptional regulator [Actinomyces bowdenii]NYS69230.1 ArgR family transcriptional regulator [Actinomyces bowdenii]
MSEILDRTSPYRQTTGASSPSTKAARHALIVRILAKERIRSQGQLRDALAARGVSTTQATLSRDLVELRATKIRSADGQVYAIPEGSVMGQLAGPTPVPGTDSLADHTTSRLARWCADLLVTVEWAGGQVVLRTLPGAAELLAAAVDDAMMPGVLGCIAGDDTVLVITRSSEISAEVSGHLLGLADSRPRS